MNLEEQRKDDNTIRLAEQEKDPKVLLATKIWKNRPSNLKIKRNPSLASSVEVARE